MINCFNDENPYKKHYNDFNLLGINTYSNTVILDLFDTISYICYTDFYTKRQEDLDNKENLSIVIPVNNVKKFKLIKYNLEKLLKYMTNGEIWNIEFIKQKETKKLERKQIVLDNTNYNSLALLSGGLDSMAGTCIEKYNNTIFVTYASNNIENNNAKTIYEKLVKTQNNVHVSIAKIACDEETHYTERTRSLIFLASCFIYADYYRIPVIKIYENGIMSLNPKFNFSRRVTKTTNQKSLYLFNEILKALELNIKIENPFKYKTKKEVIEIIPKEYDNAIQNETRTCSKNSGIIHFRNKSIGNFHCGICIACVLRQIGMINAKRADANYLLPIDKHRYNEVLRYEYRISKNKNTKSDIASAVYKFNEKRSLIEYYKSYYKNIKNGNIFNYLDMKIEYYEDENYLIQIKDMLDRFSKELKLYFEKVGLKDGEY